MGSTPAELSRNKYLGDELQQALWEALEQALRAALGTIKSGSVTLHIQDGQIIQVDKSEKICHKKPEFIDGWGI